MRTKACIHTLTGHTNTVSSVLAQSANPQVCACVLWCVCVCVCGVCGVGGVGVVCGCGCAHTRVRCGVCVCGVVWCVWCVVCVCLCVHECVLCPAHQVVTASHDSTIRLWDLAAGKTSAVLTNHKKSIRSVVLHPSE